MTKSEIIREIEETDKKCIGKVYKSSMLPFYKGYKNQKKEDLFKILLYNLEELVKWNRKEAQRESCRINQKYISQK